MIFHPVSVVGAYSGNRSFGYRNVVDRGGMR